MSLPELAVLFVAGWIVTAVFVYSIVRSVSR